MCNSKVEKFRCVYSLAWRDSLGVTRLAYTRLWTDTDMKNSESEKFNFGCVKNHNKPGREIYHKNRNHLL